MNILSKFLNRSLDQRSSCSLAPNFSLFSSCPLLSTTYNLQPTNRGFTRLNFSSKNFGGFTIVELIISIVIIGILAAITLVSYNGIQARVASNTLKSDLDNASAQLEIYQLKNGSYPASVDIANYGESLIKSEGTVYQYVLMDGNYCLAASSESAGSSVFHISSTDGIINEGVCTFAFASSLTATLSSVSSINLSWPAVTGASSYNLQQDTAPSFETATTIYSQSNTSYTSTGLLVSTEYFYRVNAIVSGNTSDWSETVSATTILSAPSSPAIAVTLSSTNVLATITPLTCSAGSIQYGIRSRTDDGTWGSYSSWSATTTATQSAIQGVKYGYQAQARCYVDDTTYSTTATGTESTYSHPIPAPSAPTVTATTVTVTTTWSWPDVTCASGTTVRYQYRYTISPSGSDSGWVAIASSPISFTTSTGGQTYTVNIQAQCYTVSTASTWSASGTASYYLPILTVLVVAGGGGGGGNPTGTAGRGGGGAGGLIYSSSYTVTKQDYPITVGLGGAGSVGSSSGSNGNNSIFGSLTAIGGGGGGNLNVVGLNGGSGGGAGYTSAASPISGGIGVTDQGKNGGSGDCQSSANCPNGNSGGGGGGGAGAVGASGHLQASGGAGGNGLQLDISGVLTWYAGGGGGGAGSGGAGGLGGGGAGNVAGIANTGGGGGGGYASAGGAGGSGIVIISYPTGVTTETGGTITTSGGNTIHTFNSSGTFTVN